MGLMNPSCLKQTVSQQRQTTRATIPPQKKEKRERIKTKKHNADVSSSERVTGVRMWGVRGMSFGPVLAVRPVSETSIWQGVQLLAFHWFLALLSPSPVFLRTPLLFGTRPCPGDASDMAMGLIMNLPCFEQAVS